MSDLLDYSTVWDDASNYALPSDGLGGVTTGPYNLYATDIREANKLDSFVAAPNGDTRPWYERVAEFGLTRAIDSHYGPTATLRNGPATYAGQNGQTYANGAYPGSSGGNMTVLLLIGIAIFAAMN